MWSIRFKLHTSLFVKVLSSFNDLLRSGGYGLFVRIAADAITMMLIHIAQIMLTIT